MNIVRTFGPVVVGRATYLPGGVCGPRIQSAFQLVVLERGSMDARLDREMVCVPNGAAVLLRPGGHEDLRFTRHAGTVHSWCAVRPDAVPEPMRRRLRAVVGRPAPFSLRCGALLQAAFEPLGASGQRFGKVARLFGALTLLAEFAAIVDGGEVASEADAGAIGRAERFIHEEYARPLDLAQIARAAGVSRQHLLRLHRLAGLPTPMECLYARRIEVARELLRQTGLRVGEVAERCGFANAFHFSRRFREATGESPRGYREALWAGGPTAASGVALTRQRGGGRDLRT